MDQQSNFRIARPWVWLALASVSAAVSTLLFSFDVVAAAADTGAETVADPETAKWAYVAAALATGLSSLGAGYAVAMVGSAAVGALVEKPEVLGRVLILAGLAEGIAIYGLIMSILILNKV